MFTDTPIERPADDKPGRLPFANEIAKGLVYSRDTSYESLVGGLNGVCGSGKSSLINLLLTEIETESERIERKCVSFRFNDDGLCFEK